MGTFSHLMVSSLPRLTAAFQHSTRWCYFGACVLCCRRCEAGGKTTPAHVHMLWKKIPAWKTPLIFFSNETQARYFETEHQTNFLRFTAKPRGCKSFFKMVFSPSEVEVQAMVATPKWLGHIIQEILIRYIIPNILPPSKFYTEELHRAFKKHQSEQFPAFSTCLHLDSALHHFQGLVYNPISFSYIKHHVFQHTPWGRLYQSAAPWPLSVWIYLHGAKERSGNKCIYKGDNIISALSPGSMSSQDQ